MLGHFIPLPVRGASQLASFLPTAYMNVALGYVQRNQSLQPLELTCLCRKDQGLSLLFPKRGTEVTLRVGVNDGQCSGY